MDTVRPRELISAARVADGLVYVAGLAGVVAGGLLFRSGSAPYAILVWVLTFIAGATLRLAAYGARALAVLLDRSERIESELAGLRAGGDGRSARAEDDADDRPVDPYRRWGGWH